MQPTAQRQTMRMDSGVLRTATMTISSNLTDAAFVLQSMTDLYANKRLAPIREIITNALDAHAAAGQTDPVQVTLPTVLSPFFTVQDFGTGLNWDDLENIYAQFGRSTKRETNDQAGMLGFGCKSPLTYVLSFTIIGVKDGVKVTAVISKNEQGIGEIKLLDECDTTEPNGVTVKIPVPANDLDNFLKDAKHFLSFQKDSWGAVRVDGEMPEPFPALLELDPDVWVIEDERYSNRKSYIVQGGVPYPYDTPHGLPSTIVWVPIGSVGFPPSREALQDNENTKATLKKIHEFIDNRLDAVIDFALESAPDAFTYWQTLFGLRRGMPYGYQNKRLSWRHRELYFKRKGVRDVYGWVVDDRTASRTDHINEGYINAHGTRRTRTVTFIRDFPLRGVSTRHKDMVEAAGISEPYFIIPKDCGLDLSGFPGCSWNDIPPLPKAQRPTKRASGPAAPRTGTKYTFFVEGGIHKEPEVGYTDPNGVAYPVIYVDNDEGKARQLSNRYNVVAASIIVASQEDRFLRLHPGAVGWRDFQKEVALKAHKALTKRDRDALNTEAWQRMMARHLGEHMKDLKDRDLRSALAVAISTSDAMTTLLDINQHEGQYVLGGYLGNTTENMELANKIHLSTQDPYHMGLPTDVLKRYPMLQHLNYHSSFTSIPAREWVIYLNARHRENAKVKSAAGTDTAADAA